MLQKVEKSLKYIADDSSQIGIESCTFSVCASVSVYVFTIATCSFTSLRHRVFSHLFCIVPQCKKKE